MQNNKFLHAIFKDHGHIEFPESWKLPQKSPTIGGSVMSQLELLILYTKKKKKCFADFHN